MSVTRRGFITFTATAAGVWLASGIPGISGQSGLPGISGAFAADGASAARRQAVSVLHFSPTGSTARVAGHLGAALANATTELDLSVQQLKRHAFGQNDLVVVAVPVYMGRVPARAVEALRQCAGNGTPCLSLTVFGNRAIDDALLELNDILSEQGFRVMASGAFVGQHSLVGEIAAGRPDAQDLAALDGFAKAILSALAVGQPAGPPNVPGKRPYVQLPAPTIVPVTAESCIDCGQCAAGCPVSAIPADDFRSTEQEKCMLCMRCVRFCPAGARSLPPEYREQLAAYMQRYAARQEPQIYL